MARLVAGTLELQAGDGSIWFEILTGGLDDVPSVRGEDSVIVGKTGRLSGTRVLDTRPVVLKGVVEGQGADLRTKQQNYRTSMDALNAVFDPSAALFSIVVHAPLEGLATGYATLASVRFLRKMGPVQSGGFWRELTLECVSIASPPAWVLTP